MGPPMTALSGRDGVLNFFQKCLDRPERNPARLLPIVVLVGRHGSGKTVLIEELRRQLKPLVPCALVYLERTPDATPGEIAAALAFQLNSHVHQFGRIAFPRLMLGLLAVRLPLDQEVRSNARRELEKELDSSAVLTAAARVVEEVSLKFVDKTGSPVVQAGEIAAQSLLTATLPRIGRLRFRSALDWYASAMNCGNGQDALIELNQAASDATPASDPAGNDQRQRARQRVDKILCEAFLADLRASYDRFSLSHGQRTVNCLALLDNAGTLSGARFLKLLADLRRANPAAPDPLVIAATAESSPTPNLPIAKAVASARAAAGYSSWARDFRPDSPGSWWYPIMLTDLSVADTKTLVRSRVLGSAERDARFLHGVTAGHPGCIRLFADVLTHLSDASSPGPAALRLRSLLDQPLDGGDGAPATVADRALELLLGTRETDADDPLLAMMVTCSPITDLGLDACKALLGQDEDINAIIEMRRRFTSVAQIHPEASTAELALRPHPLLRRLLLRRLVQRGDAVDGWNAVHGKLARHYRERGARAAMLYHQLALDQLGDVAAELDDWLGRLKAGAWRDMLYAIAAAPGPVPVTGPPVRFVEERVKRLGPLDHRLRTVARLVAACRLHQDWLSDPNHALASFISIQFEHLTLFGIPDSEVFLDEFERYRATVIEWS